MFQGNKGRKEREIKISKSYFFIFILTYIILGFFPGCFYTQKPVYFLCESFRYFLFYSHYFHSFASAHACLPTSGDSLRFIFFLFATKQAGTAFSHESFLYFCFCYIKIMNPFFLSVSFPRTRREVPSFARR